MINIAIYLFIFFYRMIRVEFSFFNTISWSFFSRLNFRLFMCTSFFARFPERHMQATLCISAMNLENYVFVLYRYNIMFYDRQTDSVKNYDFRVINLFWNVCAESKVEVFHDFPWRYHYIHLIIVNLLLETELQCRKIKQTFDSSTLH